MTRDDGPHPKISSVLSWLLSRLLGEDDARVLLSELQEGYELRRESEGVDAALRALRWDTRRAVGHAILARFKGDSPSPTPMRPFTIRNPRSALMDGLGQDIRVGLRSLRRRPLFSFIAILTLSLGIASATTVFSVVEGVLLRPLPFPRPQELVTVSQAIPRWQSIEALKGGWNRVGFNQPAFQRVREGQSSFTEFAAYRLTTTRLVEEDELIRFPLGVGSSSLFSVLGVRPVLGRFFLPEEDGPAAGKVAVVSQEFWQERFGSDPDVLGRSVNLSGQPHTIVGVLPAGFRLRYFGGSETVSSNGFWVPLGLDSESFRHGSDMYQGIARLRPQVTMARAEEEATTLIQGDPIASDYEAKVRSLTEEWTGAYRRPLALLFGAALVLLLIACGNVAALLIGETPGREGEMATRRALGAGGRRLGQQLLVESLLLGVAGSLFGMILSLVGTRILVTLAPPIPRLESVGINGWALVFSMIAGIATSLAFGLAPVLQILRGRAREALARGGRVKGSGGGLLHRAVVSGEVALTALLLVGGGLLARSLFTLLDVDTGFQQESLVEARVSIPSYLESDPTQCRLIFEEMVDALGGIPGVIGVSATSSVPFSGGMTRNVFTVIGRSPGEAVNGYRPLAQRRQASPGFFSTMGIPVLRGREFVPGDQQGAQLVAVISQSMAERFWPDEDPLGVRFNTMRDTVTIVGVVGDVRHASLRADPRPTFYVALAQQADLSTVSLVIRARQDPEPLLPQIREAIRTVHPRAPIQRLQTAPSLVADSVRDEGFRAILFAVFGAVAVFLAGAGVFGVTARGVETRKGEMGIRMALGAQRSHLLRLTLLPGLLAGLVGLGLGLAGALGASRLLKTFLFGVEPWDPATYGVVALTVLGMSLAATYFPSLRIEGLDPATVLREE